MKKEFKSLKKLKNENIIRVEDFLIDDMSGTAYLVMELFEGVEMFEFISNIGKYSENTAIFLFRELIEGI